MYRPATSTQSRSQRDTNHSASDAELTPTPIAPIAPSARSPARAGIRAVQRLGPVLVRVVDQRDIHPVQPQPPQAGLQRRSTPSGCSRAPGSARGCRRTHRRRPRSPDRPRARAAGLPWWTPRTRRAAARPGTRRSAARTAPPRSAARCRRPGSPRPRPPERGGAASSLTGAYSPPMGAPPNISEPGDQRAVGDTVAARRGPTGYENSAMASGSISVDAPGASGAGSGRGTPRRA